MILEKEFLENYLKENSGYYVLNLMDKDITQIDPTAFQIQRLNPTRLCLSKNKIASIKSETFSTFSYLKILDLNENQLSRIEFGAFNGLNSLESLNLADNKISWIHPKAFYNLEELEILDGSSPNRLVNLNELNLNKNEIRKIHSDAFNTL